ncbi:ABC transporter permease [Thiopseudomonas alkaliphila]|uniref:ABC transporter permease n=1 Tax=Thiopseudomonas alkaliphila TaxID=1697053 RepID=UPI002576E845|nr:ABC transporter permease [Thiopseudomonas alkaliphila]MDM1715532.1 ABC transporter permease [Thiopseudomonas alkaliphila]
MTLNELWTERLIAWHFLKQNRQQTLLISLGIALGTAVIIFISALMGGLQANIVERTLGALPHISLEMPQEINHQPPSSAASTVFTDESLRPKRLRTIYNWQAVVERLEQTAGLTAVSPIIAGPAIVLRGKARVAVTTIGIDLARYIQVTPLDQYLIAGQLTVGSGYTLIGQQLAEDLGVKVGDKLRLEGTNQQLHLLTIAGIFNAGSKELDSRYLYLNLKQTQAIQSLPGGVTRIELKTEEIFSAQQQAQQLQRITGLQVESWMQQNTQILNALTSQRMATGLIRFFIAISVAFGIASVLAVSVAQRTREIGILRAMGAYQQQILRVFLVQGTVLGFLGALVGSGLAAGLIGLFNQWGTQLFSVRLTGSLVAASIGIAMLSGLLAAWLPARRAARLNPVEAIRYA